jgi:selenide, water dikinase
LQGIVQGQDERMLCGTSNNEDAAVLRFPEGMALIQTVDFFTPIVNDPFLFGQIAAANSLSDVYAMGGNPLSAMNIVTFPAKTMDKAVLRSILKGGLQKIHEAGAMLAGGHSVEDDVIKYGLSVSGYVDPHGFATNGGLRPEDILLLTKPLGTGVMATAIKADWEGSDLLEAELGHWAARLNSRGGEAIRMFGIKGSTDITGFGLGGHALEMARASGVDLELWAGSVPLLDPAIQLASMGMIPAGSFANKNFCSRTVSVDPSLDPLLVDLLFDAQTSGGLLLGVPEAQASEVGDFLKQGGDLAAAVGRVLGKSEGRLIIR